MTIFAAGEFVSIIIFLVFAGIGLVNQIMTQRQAADRRKAQDREFDAPPPEPDRAKVQAAPPPAQGGNEIDRFLQEILGQAPSAPPPPPQRPRQRAQTQEVVDLKPKRQTLVEERKQEQERNRRQHARDRAQAEIEIENRVDAELDEVGRQATVGAAQKVRDAGQATQTSGTNLNVHNTTKVTGNVRILMRELRTPEGLRRAFVLSQILGRPVSKRH